MLSSATISFIADTFALAKVVHQVTRFQGNAHLVHQLVDKEVQDTAWDSVSHVHLDDIEASHNIPFNLLNIFNFLKWGGHCQTR